MPRTKGRLSKGQPQGTRSASGRKRDRTPGRVEPNMGVLRRRQFYGIPANDTNMCDAIGRAYSAGLLGHGDGEDRAQRYLNAGRKIAAQYWRVLGFHTPDSLARFQPSNPCKPLNPEDEKIREQALNDALDCVRKCGHDVRRSFDQLVIDPNPDHGPTWLDRIIYFQRSKRTPPESDMNMLRLALIGLEAIA